MRARTVSPGRPRRTKTTKPSRRATPLPPYASESMRSSSSSSRVTGGGIGPRLTKAEEVEARLEPLDLDRERRVPACALEPEEPVPHRHAARRGDLLAGVGVAELLRDPGGRDVALERPRRGDVDPEPLEEE